MRRSAWFFFLVTGLSLVCAPLLAHAQVLNAIIPTTGACTCPGLAPDWGCVLGTLQIVLNDIVALSSILITVYIAWAGVAYLSAPISAEGRTKARQRIVNAVIGLLIVLCAWLLINSLMTVIYNANASADGVTQLGFWNSILSDTNTADDCIKPKTPPALPDLTAGSNSNGGSASVTTQPASGVATAPPSSLSGAGGACSASNIESAVQAEGGTISSQNASFMGCVAAKESSCGSNPTAYTFHTPGSSAYGPFQVLLQTNAQYFNNPQCEAVAGVNGPLNCQNAFSGGNPVPGPTLNACEKAAGDLGCEAEAGAALRNAGGSPWATSVSSCGT